MVKMKLHILLDKYRISQREFAQQTHIRYATVNSYANQTYKHIVNKHIDVICTYFDCNIEDLIEYTKDNH